MKSGSEVFFHSFPINQPADETALSLTMGEIPALGSRISEVPTILMEVPSPQSSTLFERVVQARSHVFPPGHCPTLHPAFKVLIDQTARGALALIPVGSS